MARCQLSVAKIERSFALVARVAILSLITLVFAGVPRRTSLSGWSAEVPAGVDQGSHASRAAV